ncbi:hypothetical protein Pcinc_009992 [Petrolisthes cinctipes]|uniref:C1q domain-containing protein n=1 Tax=Petrolisthes cinctipes TaxID=88211 RepID=A0AAE1G5V5_PETCI|nr:hypothetical protein Pcinc_009992 [Petrolisthes cinctipes]
MARLLLVTLVTLLGFGQGDRSPVNFPVGEGNPTRPTSPAGFDGDDGGDAGFFGRCYGGFSVTQGFTEGRNGYIQFKNVLLNMGGWSQTYSDFQAPCAGVYYFSFHAVSTERGGPIKIQLYKNRQYQVTAYSGHGGNQQVSNSVLLPLQERDIVHLQLEQGNIYDNIRNEAYTSFSGYLVQSY